MIINIKVIWTLKRNQKQSAPILPKSKFQMKLIRLRINSKHQILNGKAYNIVVIVYYLSYSLMMLGGLALKGFTYTTGASFHLFGLAFVELIFFILIIGDTVFRARINQATMKRQ